ncbi:MAG: methylmalonyl Co-A mutase-associated GTPase MeaB, partial [Ilumatobacteraceae bacterium]
AAMEKSGDFARRRVRQQIDWMWSTVEERLVDDFRRRADVRNSASRLEKLLAEGTITPTAAAREILGLDQP